MNAYQFAAKLNLTIDGNGQLASIPEASGHSSRIDWVDVAYLAEELPDDHPFRVLSSSFTKQRYMIVDDAEKENGGPVTDFDECCPALDKLLTACEQGFGKDVQTYFDTLLGK